MTDLVPAPAGAPCWTDLATSDAVAAQRFYGAVFGWQFEDAGEDYGHYIRVSIDGDGVGGLMQSNPDFGVQNNWSIYLASPDAKATVAAAVDAGGSAVVDAMPVGELGSMAMVVDPTGAAIGVWQPGQLLGGIAGRAGAPVWHELHTRNFAAAVTFYESVFGWSTEVMSDTDDFRYTRLMGPAGEPLAGIMDASGFLPDGTPSSWQLYLGSDDVDSTLAAVVAAGGSVIEPAVDTPYGRLAKVADPLGATFKVSSVRMA